MFADQTLVIIIGILGFLLVMMLGVTGWIARRSYRAMESLMTILTRPERARAADAARVLNTIMADEMAKIQSNFLEISAALGNQISAAEKMQQDMVDQNEKLAEIADDATKKVAMMSQRLDNTVTGLMGVVGSASWTDVGTCSEKFTSDINELMSKIDTTSQEMAQRIGHIQECMGGWVSSSKELSSELTQAFEKNDTQMKSMTSESDAMRQNLDALAKSTADGFDHVRTAAADYAGIMDKNDKLLTSQLTKMDMFSKQSKKQLATQVNTLSSTANVIGAQVMLAETSVEKQIQKLTDAVEALMTSATTTEASIRGISGELATLTNRFNGEIREFAGGVVGELKTVSGVANTTLENTKTAATAFSDSVRAMASGVRETLMEMNTAHSQLSGQSEALIKMSVDTTARLQPLSELIERYYAALPELAQGSSEMGENLEKIVAGLTDKIAQMREIVADSMTNMSDSSAKIEDLAGQSRQQMIDLMSDYSKAVDTMQTLNKQMMVARATAPMDAIGTAPVSFAPVSSTDFMTQAEKMIQKLHEQSVDLTRATGAEIPDIVLKKYHAGDTEIFSKWLAKMLAAANKKQIRDLLKNDSVFRSQAAQFTRAFAKILSAATQTDAPDATRATLLKTDLGQIYTALRGINV